MKTKWVKRVTSWLLSFVMVFSMFLTIPSTEALAATAGQLEEGTSYILVSGRSGKALTVENYSSENGAKLVQMPVNNYESQIWTLDVDDDGYYQIVNRFSGKALDVPWSSTKEGVAIEQFNKGNADNQKWKITDVKDGYCRISPKTNEALALNVKGGTNADGAQIIQWTYSGATNELWEIREVKQVNRNPGGGIRVTCVGDSITEGYRASDSAHAYPGQLQKLLGDDYEVLNVGVSGSTVRRSLSNAYSRTSRYTRGLQSMPDIVIIMIGTNDAVTGVDKKAGQDEFRRDYAALIEEYQMCGSNPKIILGLPLTSVDQQNKEDDRDDSNEANLIPIIKDLAKQYNLQLLDMHTYTGSWTRNDYLGDGLHPNDAGYEKLARVYANAILGYTKGFTGDLQEDTNYTILSKSSGQAMTIEDYSTSNHAGLCQMSAKNYASQAFKLIGTEDGYYQIVNQFSGKALDVPRSSTAQGVQIIQYDRGNGDNQKWKIEANGDGSWRISPKLAPNQALNVYRNSKAEGGMIVQWPYAGDANEAWEMRAMDTVNANPLNGSGSVNTFEMEEGTLEGGAVLRDLTGTSGGKYVGFVGGPDNGRVTVNVASTTAGKQKMKVYYATLQARQLAVVVNGTAYHVNCAGTGGWTVVGAPVEVEVDLQAGNNTITLTGVNGAYAPNIDRIEF